MNPLLRTRERPLALEAAEIAENVVAALLDVNEDQIFASSRRYLAHAVIGPFALANSHELIIDCAQGQVGDDNVKPMLLFMLRMLHRQMQRERPRSRRCEREAAKASARGSL